MLPEPIHILTAAVGRLRRPTFDARAATELLRFGLPFFPPSRFALAPSALLTVLNEIIINGRRRVLELGAGCSTLYIAKALAATDGHLVSVESDPAWLRLVEKAAREAGVAERITGLHAPIVAHASGAGWYDAALIRDRLEPGSIDLLLVDGPVASSRANARARAPAIAELGPFLAPDCAIFLDDIHRPSHARIAEEWGKALGVDFGLFHSRGGFAYAARGRAYDPIL